MDELKAASKRLKVAHDGLEQHYQDCIAAQDKREIMLFERMTELNERKQKAVAAYGNIYAAADDLVEVNAGGRVISVEHRSILTQLVGTRIETIFSGRWDKKLLRDSNGVIFLDLNPDCFQAIVDYLGEKMISSESDPPSPPSVEDEHDHILRNQLELFGFVPTVERPTSTIIKHEGHCKILHDWLKEDDSDGEFTLLFEDLAMVYQVKRFTQTATTRAVLSPSSKRLVVVSLGGIPTRPGRAAQAMVSPTRLFCLHSPAAVFCLPAK